MRDHRSRQRMKYATDCRSRCGSADDAWLTTLVGATIIMVEVESRTRFTRVALPKAGSLSLPLANQRTRSGLWSGVRGRRRPIRDPENDLTGVPAFHVPQTNDH